jgi:hypothetical protein
LTSEPLRIDVLVVKKKREVVLRKNLARIFRRDNIIEYKSPDDTFSVEDFCRTMGYCYVYASNNKCPVNEISLTVVSTGDPRSVFDHLAAVYHWWLDETDEGIYTVRGEGMAFPIQLINSRKLSETENLWLKDLRHNLSPESLGRVITASDKLEDGALLSTYLDLLARANPETIMEVWKMMYPTADEVYERAGIAAHFEERGAEKERQKTLALQRQVQSLMEQLRQHGITPAVA